MRLLIVYGTTEGQTRKIVRFVAEHVEAAGHVATVMDATDAQGGLDLSGYDAAIVAASVHVGRYQTSVQHLVSANIEALSALPTLFLSVSLAAAGDDQEMG